MDTDPASLLILLFSIAAPAAWLVRRPPRSRLACILLVCLMAFGPLWLTGHYLPIAILFRFLAGLWPVWVMPCVLMLLARPGGRLTFYLLGIAFAYAAPLAIGPQGPDSFLLVIPLYGILVSFAAALAELLVRLHGLARPAPAESGP